MTTDASTPITAAPAETAETGLTTLETARMQIATIWTYGSVVVISLIVLRTINYPNHAHDLWTFALPTFMPVATLIFSVIAATAIVPAGAKDDPIYVRRGFFQLSRAVSIFYLLLLAFWMTFGASTASYFFSMQDSRKTAPAPVAALAPAAVVAVPSGGGSMDDAIARLPAPGVTATTPPPAPAPAVSTGPTSGTGDSPFVQGLMVGNYFLTPLQSLVVALLSAMFFSKEKAGTPSGASAPGGTPPGGDAGGKPPV